MKISKVLSIHVHFLQESQFTHRLICLIWEGQKSSHFTEFIYKKITLQDVPPPLLKATARIQFQFPFITYALSFVSCLMHPVLFDLFAISLTHHFLKRHIYCLKHLSLKHLCFIKHTSPYMFKKKRYIKNIIWLVLHLKSLLLLGRLVLMITS